MPPSSVRRWTLSHTFSPAVVYFQVPFQVHQNTAGISKSTEKVKTFKTNVDLFSLSPGFGQKTRLRFV